MRVLLICMVLLASLTNNTTAEVRNPAGRVVSCVPKRLMAVVERVSRHYGKPAIIVSGYRSRAYNRRIGGARDSYHMRCQAIDFMIRGVSARSLAATARRYSNGGVGLYSGRPFIHVDTGPRREWYWKR
jgi:uncharacterized protein YcbK (DUF882 family)